MSNNNNYQASHIKLHPLFATAKESILSGSLKTVKKLLKSKKELIHCSNEYTQTLLHLAAIEGQYDIVKYLLRKKADVNAQDKLGWTPIFGAASSNQLHIIDLLLDDPKIQITIESFNGSTFLHYYVRMKISEKEQNEFQKIFIKAMNPKYNINLNHQNHLGETPLHHACFKGLVISVKLLLEYKADCNLSNLDNETCFHWSIRSGNLQIVKLIFPEIINPLQEGKHGTIFDLLRNRDEIKAYLLEYISEDMSKPKLLRSSSEYLKLQSGIMKANQKTKSSQPPLTSYSSSPTITEFKYTSSPPNSKPNITIIDNNNNNNNNNNGDEHIVDNKNNNKKKSHHSELRHSSHHIRHHHKHTSPKLSNNNQNGGDHSPPPPPHGSNSESEIQTLSQSLPNPSSLSSSINHVVVRTDRSQTQGGKPIVFEKKKHHHHHHPPHHSPPSKIVSTVSTPSTPPTSRLSRPAVPARSNSFITSRPQSDLIGSVPTPPSPLQRNNSPMRADVAVPRPHTVIGNENNNQPSPSPSPSPSPPSSSLPSSSPLSSSPPSNRNHHNHGNDFSSSSPTNDSSPPTKKMLRKSVGLIKTLWSSNHQMDVQSRSSRMIGASADYLHFDRLIDINVNVSSLPESNKILIDRFKLCEIVGKGANANVFKAVDNSNSSLVAIKQFHLRNVKRIVIDTYMAEVKLLQSLQCDFIVKFICYYRSENDINFVMEYVGGSLLQRIKFSSGLSEEQIVKYIFQILLGLHYLHENNIIHRDIKSANILINNEGKVKIADFGLAMIHSESSNSKNAMNGSPYWMAPEIVLLQTLTTKSDIWSLGCTIIEMITENPPYFSLEPMCALFAVVRDDIPPIPNDISIELYDFVRLCLQKDLQLRPTALELLLHPLIVKHRTALCNLYQNSFFKDSLDPFIALPGNIFTDFQHLENNDNL